MQLALNIEKMPSDQWPETILTYEEYKLNVELGGFIDYDGYGVYLDDDLNEVENSGVVLPSQIEKFNKNFKWIKWFNR